MATVTIRNNTRAYADAGYWQMHLGHSQDGLADIETALRLDPHSNQAAEWQTHLCYLRAHLAQWEPAIDQCGEAWLLPPLGTNLPSAPSQPHMLGPVMIRRPKKAR